MSPELPSRTVTFLFTDIEGSTRLLHELGADAYAQALSGHRRVLRDAFAAHGGVEVDTQGDAFFVAFQSAPDAIAAARAAQDALASGGVRVRIGLHTGTPKLAEEGYVGADVHLGARIAAAGHGGQVLLSKATRELVDAEVSDLGEHRLKDFAEPVWLFQLGSERFPPLKTISNTNLPRPASSFIGRERAVDDIASLLRDGTRLLTLTGAGGSGKTRLAIEAAAELVPDFLNGVFWVGCSALRNPGLVLDTIAQTLGAKDGLAEHIGERELLLLLDNLEQVISAGPALAALVEHCRNLTLLVTSRELLRVRGEVEYAVPPIAEPDAVDLFCARSGLDPIATIAELVRRLDNLPLAVELAAARTSVLSPEQILDRLSQRLDLLKGGRDAAARQQTLRATIEWSYELLDDDERCLFARLAVFRGGCTLEAAEQVADAELDVLQSLVDKNLLRHSDGRFWILETIRELALEKLALLEDAEPLRRRHAEYLLDVVPAVAERDDAALAARWNAEADNVRAALAWALCAQNADLALKLAGRKGLYRITARERTSWLDAALLLADRADPAIYARGLADAAGGHYALGDYDLAADVAQRSLDQFLALGDLPGQSLALRWLGMAALERGDYERARERLERSLELAGAGSPSDRRAALHALGEFERDAGNLDRAAALLEEALQLALDAGVTAHGAWIEHGLGDTALLSGDTTPAGLHYRRALSSARELGMVQLVAACLAGLASVAATRGDRARAGHLWGASEAIQRSEGTKLKSASDSSTKRLSRRSQGPTSTTPQTQRETTSQTRRSQPRSRTKRPSPPMKLQILFPGSVVGRARACRAVSVGLCRLAGRAGWR